MRPVPRRRRAGRSRASPRSRRRSLRASPCACCSSSATTPRPTCVALVERARAAGVRALARRAGRSAAHEPRRRAANARSPCSAPHRAAISRSCSRAAARSGCCIAPRYASNVGFAIRTAEVSGADGVIVDAAFNHEERTRVAPRQHGRRSAAARALGVDRATLAQADAHGHRVIAIEDAATRAPWQVDLTGDVVLIAGGERDGIGAALLARCDEVVRVPMAGFVPSYNLQAAISAVAARAAAPARSQLAARSSRYSEPLVDVVAGSARRGGARPCCSAAPRCPGRRRRSPRASASGTAPCPAR